MSNMLQHDKSDKIFLWILFNYSFAKIVKIVVYNNKLSSVIFLPSSNKVYLDKSKLFLLGNL